MYVVKILRTIIPLNESFNQRIIAQKWLSGVLTHYDTSKQKIVQQSHLRDMKL